MPRAGWMGFVLAALLVTSGSATAGDVYVYVPDGKITSAEPIAWYPWETPWIQGEVRCHYLIPASLLPGRPLWVKDIGFGPYDVRPGLAAGVCQVRIAHCRRSSLSTTFADNLETDLTRVHEDALFWVPVPYQWWDVGLNMPDKRPFLYNGRDNMVIEIRFNAVVNTMRAVTCCGSHNIQIVKNQYPGAYNAPMSDGNPLGASAIAKMRITMGGAVLVAGGTPRPGGTVNLTLEAINDEGYPYQIGSSLGTGPILIDRRRLDLTPDDLLVATVNDLWPWLFSGYRGVIDGNARATAAIHIPGIPVFIGMTIHTAFVTLDAQAPSSIRSISNTASFQITK
jgi:hypothetical protein